MVYPADELQTRRRFPVDPFFLVGGVGCIDSPDVMRCHEIRYRDSMCRTTPPHRWRDLVGEPTSTSTQTPSSVGPERSPEAPALPGGDWQEPAAIGGRLSANKKTPATQVGRGVC